MSTFQRFSLAKDTFSLEVVVKDAVKGTYLHTMFSAKSRDDLMLKVYTACTMSEFELERVVLYQAEKRLRITEQSEGGSRTVDYDPVFVA